MLTPDADEPDETLETSRHQHLVMETVRQLGLLRGESSRIGARVRRGLVEAAKKTSGIDSDTELIEYALAKVVLEDDFGLRLVRRKGHIPQEIDLEL
ncbi:MAG: hypothetical protein FWD68_01965 [Alphaproteobacteria bacterium]|nr:hypothetical protein [Alphaproteobacteria bacterium]